MTWLIAFFVLALVVHVGMALTTAIPLRRAGVPTVRAWAVALLAWPLVRRVVAAADTDEAGADRA